MSEPHQPPAVVQAHLAECPACQELQRRLLQVERAVPCLPVPASLTQDEFLDRFRNEATIWEKVQLRARNLKHWQLTAAAVAASIMLFYLAYSLAPKDQPVANRGKQPAPDRLLTTLLDRNLKLTKDTSPKDQVVTLADLSEDLRNQSQPLAYYGQGNDGKEALKDLAEWYGQAVRIGVARAGELPPPERRPVLGPIAEQLAKAGDDAQQLAKEKAQSADHPLFTIAFAAKNGKDQLDTLLKHDIPPEGQGAAPGAPAAARGRAEVAFLSRGVAIKAVMLQAVLVASGGAVRAESPSSSVVAFEQAQSFQRNRKLIQSLVDNCLKMAEQKDIVRRADSCTLVADRLAEEIELAASKRDVYRATELGNILKDLMVKGIAFNLTTAQDRIPKGAVREPEMLQIGDHVQRLTDQLQDKLSHVSDKDTNDWQRIVQGIIDGRTKVNEALKGRGAY
jgi:hypothetical protein